MSARPNTDYGMRMPGHAEIRRTFGSLARAVEITGGDLPTVLFYLHNPQRIANAPPCDAQPGEWAKELREAALVEQAAATFDALEKPTIVAVADSIGVCRQVARRALVTAGKWPKVPADALA
jgi:hypothetical protein